MSDVEFQPAISTRNSNLPFNIILALCEREGTKISANDTAGTTSVASSLMLILQLIPMNMQTDSRIKTVITTDPMENEWRKLFVLTGHWQSDLKFFSDELDFLRTLVDKHFSTLMKEEHIDSTKSTVSQLGKLENRRSNFEQKINRHYDHLAALIEDPFPHDAQTYRDEHAKLEAAMVDFVKDFRQVKRAVFQLTREVMDGEKTSHLLTK